MNGPRQSGYLNQLGYSANSLGSLVSVSKRRSKKARCEQDEHTWVDDQDERFCKKCGTVQWLNEKKWVTDYTIRRNKQRKVKVWKTIPKTKVKPQKEKPIAVEQYGKDFQTKYYDEPWIEPVRTRNPSFL